MTPNRFGRGAPTVWALLAALLLTGCAAMQGASRKLEKSMEAQRAHDAGLALYKTDKYAEAIPHFRRALAIQADFDEAESYLAWSLYHGGKYPEASRHFRQALARQPRWEGLHDGLGWCLYEQGQYPAAIAAFREALALDDRYRDALVGLAYALFESRRYADALPHLERLTREGEGHAMLQSPTKDVENVRSRLAWSLYHLGRYERARGEFRTGIAARPDWYGLHTGLGWTLLKLGNRPAARQSFERALGLKPDYADAREGLAQAR